MIRLPSGEWILRDRLSGKNRETSEFDEQAAIEIEDEPNENIQSPPSSPLTIHPPHSSLQSAGSPNNSSSPDQRQVILNQGDECALENCMRPTGEEATYIQFIHCCKRFHIRCVNFTKLRAEVENLICPLCDNTSI